MLTFQRYSNSDLAAAIKADDDSAMADVEDVEQHAHAHVADVEGDETDEQQFISPETEIKELMLQLQVQV